MMSQGSLSSLLAAAVDYPQSCKTCIHVMMPVLFSAALYYEVRCWAVVSPEEDQWWRKTQRAMLEHGESE